MTTLRPHDASALADRAESTDAVVVGSGLAGLEAALGLAPHRVVLLTKGELGLDGSSHWAQGGVAAAVAEDDSPSLHARDTLAAGAGLSDPMLVEILTGEGPGRILRLMELGARFDRRPDGNLALGREGAHGRRRVLHADGDATGAEMVRALREAILASPSVDVRERAFATDLVVDGGRVVGVLYRDDDGETVLVRASVVVLASGGFGQLYSRTTNPPEATGDGLAMAARAGAELADLEMVQFHPTALADPDVLASGGGVSLPLVTEALRGEGAILVDDTGERFMPAIHPMAELAPRDVVARAIWRREASGRRVLLDAREAVGEEFPKRFPTVFASCRRLGIDPRREPIPVTPAAHYAMAGVAVDERGRTSLAGLWACGELSSTGVHGANRLASNSLLEALVFGARVAEDASATLRPGPRSVPREERVWREVGEREMADGECLGSPDVARTVRRRLWDRAGLVRDGEGLAELLRELDDLDAGAEPSEAGNLLTVARLVTAAALAREESRGSHFRTDFPEPRADGTSRHFWRYRPDGDGFPLVATRARPTADRVGSRGAP